MKTLIINGYKIKDIPGFYEEINLVFMKDEEWKLGESLDAFNDLLYGGFGEIKGDEKVRLIWQNFEENRNALGFETTKNFYRKKLGHPERYNQKIISKNLEDLENGSGKTYFEILLEIIAEHSNITLLPA